MHPLDEMNIYLRYCLVLSEMGKLVEYLLPSPDELYGTLFRRPTGSLFALYQQINRLPPPEELAIHEMITHIQDQLIPKPAVSPDLSLVRSAIRSQASLEEIVKHFHVEFWRTLSSIPFGAWVCLATGCLDIPRCVQSLLAAVDEARGLFSGLTPAGRLDNSQLDLFHPAPRSMMSIISVTDYEDSLVSLSKHIVGTIPGFVPRVYQYKAPSTSERASIVSHAMQHLYFLDIAKARLQDACQQETKHSWSRVLFCENPPLEMVPDLVDTFVEQMTNQHSVLLRQLTENDIIHSSRKFRDTCVLWEDLSYLAAEAVRARKDKISVLLAYMDSFAAKKNNFALVAFVVGLGNINHPFQGLYETMSYRPYCEMIEKDECFLPHLLPFATQRNITAAHIRLALAKIAEYVEQTQLGNHKVVQEIVAQETDDSRALEKTNEFKTKRKIIAAIRRAIYRRVHQRCHNNDFS